MRVTLIFVVFSLSIPMIAADNAFIGTWKLNPEKSKYSPGPAVKDETIKFEVDGDKVRRIAQGTQGDGKPIEEGGPEGSSFPWDGQFHVVSKPSEKPEIRISVKMVDSHHVIAKIMMDGKLANTVHDSVSKDGKHDSEISDGFDMKGMKAHSVEVFDKQ